MAIVAFQNATIAKNHQQKEVIFGNQKFFFLNEILIKLRNSKQNTNPKNSNSNTNSENSKSNTTYSKI